MARGRPSNPSKGTQRPDESRPPQASAAGTPPPGERQPGPASAQTPNPAATPPATPTPPPSQPAATPSPTAGGPPAPAGTPSATSSTGPATSAPAAAGSATPSPAAATPGQGRSTPPPSPGTAAGAKPSGTATPPGKPTAPPSPAPSRTGGFVPGIVGGVVGAVLAVLGAPFVQGPPPLAPEPAARLASVESSATAQGEQLGAIGARVEELQALADGLEPTVRSAVEAAVAEVPSRDATALATLDERLAGLADEVGTLGETVAALVDPLPLLSEQSERLTALQATLGALDARLSAESERLDAARAAESERLDAARAAESERLDTARAEATAGLEAGIAETATRLDGLTGELADEIRGTREAADTAVAEARTALEGALGDVRAELQTALGAITEIRSTVETMQQARGRAAAAALLVREIDQTIDAGAPFAEPLERLTAMAGEDPELEPTLATLRGYAADGVPTIAQLRADLAALAETAPTPAVAGYEWLGQTVENITGLVTVRDKESTADIATGRLALADDALREGDVAAAIATVEEIAAEPDAVDPAAAEAWLADARARLAAETARDRLDAHIRELLTATVN